MRLKRFLEMRGADGGPWNRLCALPAFWVGLLYDQQALAEVEAYVADWSVAEISALRDGVSKMALQTPFRDGKLQDVAIDVLNIAKGAPNGPWLVFCATRQSRGCCILLINYRLFILFR